MEALAGVAANIAEPDAEAARGRPWDGHADAVAGGEEIAVADQGAAADEACPGRSRSSPCAGYSPGEASWPLMIRGWPRLRLGGRAQQQPQERAEARESDRASAHRVLL